LAFAVFYAASIQGNNRTVRVLFIGNSLTAVNNLPGMVADIAKSHGYKMIYDAYTPGGARLAQHAADAKVLEKLREQPWDFVVLQEQSQFPGFSHKQLSTDVFPYAKRLAEAVKEAHRHTSVVFYMAMARRNGDPANKHVSPELLTYEGMQKRVNRCYLEMAKDNRGLIAPVGEVWKTIRRQNPNFDLYSDDIHPNKTGTYLAACVFYATFFRSPSTGSLAPREVNRATAQSLQKVVDRIVLRAEGRWDWRK
ncbi:MAG: DUF4886 domain-containing protein, partial [Syntrophobacteria bacterium]